MSNDEKPIVLFETVERWESWLSENPDHAGVRLQIRRKLELRTLGTRDHSMWRRAAPAHRRPRSTGYRAAS